MKGKRYKTEKEPISPDQTDSYIYGPDINVLDIDLNFISVVNFVVMFTVRIVKVCIFFIAL